jgi:hypothetical protein
LAAFFKIPNVEGPDGWLSKISYDQLWTWIEFNRLCPFLEERGDYQTAQIASAVYNVNIVDKDKLTKPSDFMLKSMEEIIRDEIEEQERLGNLDTKDQKQANLAAWNSYIKRLTNGRKPVETTFKG